MIRSKTLLRIFVCVFLCGAITATARAADKVDFARQIKPILAKHCFACHGPDRNKQENELRLDVPNDELKEVITAGNSAKSDLYQRLVTKDVDEMMPPADSKGPRLNKKQIELIRRWIDEGGQYDAHWAYVKPLRPSVPKTNNAWVIGAIDHFVAAGHASHGYKPAPQADRRTLIRRLYFDLIGLPPKPAEIDAFVADKSPQAHEKLVDRLLANKHFGERIAIYWLDLVRFADTNGIHGDNHREHAPFRDWVIAAFNNNKPYDEFTVEQLAGDLLPKPTLQQKVASGYNRLNMTTREGGAQAKEYRAKYAADRVRNVSTVWMATTMGCTECHDHKYDPFLTKDFYRLASFFADVQETAVGAQGANLKVPTPEQMAQLKKAEEELAGLRKRLADAVKEPKEKQDALKKQIAAVEGRVKQLKNAGQPTLIAVAGKPRVMRVLPRGNWLDDSGEIVTPGVPAYLKQIDLGERRGTRLDLAKWMVARDNPLTARVFVNRLWKLMFGRGIAVPLDDFGTQGTLPTHPELLDWLAVEFMESGWNTKHMLKLMVMSNTYRQSSTPTAELQKNDPQNQWLARQGRFRLDAEIIRDNALAVSGLLVLKMGGRSVKPYQPAGYWAHLNFPRRTYKHDSGENQYRRGLYTYWARTFLHPAMVAFDAPSREECTVERPQSNTPLQALVLLNDPSFVEAARVFATRIVREGQGDFSSRLGFAYREALGRKPKPAEEKILAGLYEKHLGQYTADKKSAGEVLTVGQAKAPTDLDAAQVAAWTSVARTILNLHETITRY